MEEFISDHTDKHIQSRIGQFENLFDQHFSESLCMSKLTFEAIDI